MDEAEAMSPSLRGKIDYFANNILYGIWMLCLLGSMVVPETGIAVFALLLAIPLGLYQLLSGLVGWLEFGNQRKGIYLLLSLGFFLAWGGWQYLSQSGRFLPDVDEPFRLVAVAAVPMLLATYYTYLNYQAYHR